MATSLRKEDEEEEKGGRKRMGMRRKRWGALVTEPRAPGTLLALASDSSSAFAYGEWAILADLAYSEPQNVSNQLRT